MRRLLANTNVVVIADNGTDGAVVQPPLTYDSAKGSMFDGGTQVPLLVSGPAVTVPGSVASELVGAVDLFPTLLGMCGVSYPSPALASIALPLDGSSFATALSGQSGYGRNFVYSEVTATPHGGGYTVRTPTHRLIRYIQIKPEHQELYNVVVDPGQHSNELNGPLNWLTQLYFDDLMTKVESVRDDGWAELYGTGCAGSAGVPMLRTQTLPRIGSAYHSYIGSVAANATAVMTVLGLSRTSSSGTPLPFDLGAFGMPGCFAQVEPMLTMLHYNGYSPPLMIPNVPALYKSEFYVQGAVGEPGTNALGLVWTRGLRCVVGR